MDPRADANGRIGSAAALDPTALTTRTDGTASLPYLAVPGRLLLRHYRWLLLVLPIYAFVFHGSAGWPLAAVLAVAAVGYNLTLSLATRRWQRWVHDRALYLRCVEIGLICIGFSLLYFRDGGLDGYRFYYDGFYAIFVALTAVSLGRKGVFWSAPIAALAVAVGQLMLAPSVPVIFSTAGLEYWAGVLMYAGTFGLFFLAIGLLAHLAADFNAYRQERRTVAAAAHRERLATLGEVTARVAHELSSPLTGIAALVEELLASPAGDPQALAMIKDEAERASEIVRELLAYVRREPGTRRASLNDAVRGALVLCNLRGDLGDIDIVRRLADGSTEIAASRGQLEQVVLNLVENSQHAISRNGGGRVIVETRARPHHVELQVSDDGPGVPAEIRDRIFDPFFTTKDLDAGTGLGLPIVKSIVADLGGSIALDSRPGFGTTFTVTFRRPPSPPSPGVSQD